MKAKENMEFMDMMKSLHAGDPAGEPPARRRAPQPQRQHRPGQRQPSQAHQAGADRVGSNARTRAFLRLGKAEVRLAGDRLSGLLRTAA